jgi:acetyl esterase/lipase
MVGDIATRRKVNEAALAQMESTRVMPADVAMTDTEVVADDGATVMMRWYVKDGSNPGSAVVYLHGGGMILGSVGLYDGVVARYVSDSGVPMLSIEYRYAPEHPNMTMVEDSYVGLLWLADHASELGVDQRRLAIMGDSGGGGVAAGLALLGRDRGGPNVAQLILIYPMLDDRNTVPDPALMPFASFDWDDNITSWDAVLGEARGGSDVSPYVAPARMADAAGLPSVYVEVGEWDIFRNESIEFARRTAVAGVSTELHVHPAVGHGYDFAAPEADLSRRSRADRVRRLQSL